MSEMWESYNFKTLTAVYNSYKAKSYGKMNSIVTGLKE